MRLFGFEIKKPEDEGNDNEKPLSFVEPINDEGAVTIGNALGGSYGMMLDMEGSAKTETELVTKYRSMSMQTEITQAVDEIVNEAISVDSHEKVVEIVLDDTELPDKVKDRIVTEFDNLLSILDFSNSAYDIFYKFYVDGRLNYHIMIDEKNLKDGIQELRYIDPRKLRLVKEVDSRDKDPHSGIPIKKIKAEYYMYSENGFGSSKGHQESNTTQGYRISKDSIARVTSGIMNENNSMVLGYLHPAIKPLNQLRMLEDAVVIYTLTRAPERRIFYIDVGNLPKAKAEQYLHDMMVRHKNKLRYDSTTGDISDSRRFMCYDLSTKIPLLDGRTLELGELIEEHKAGKENWVYSCDPKTGKFYPGPVSWAGITKKNADVVKVTFDNGKHVICTPDHKFPVWGKGFVEAQHLTSEDSIIPGYRRKAKVTENTTVEYEQIYKNETGKWEFTHREVARWKDVVGLREEFVHNDSNASMKKGVVHHKNFDVNNNNPSNLLMMNYKDHMEYHREINSVLYNAEIYDIVEECAIAQYSVEKALLYINKQDSIIESWRLKNTGRHIGGREPDTLAFTYKDLKRISSLLGFKNWKLYRGEFEQFEREANGRKRRSEFAKGSAEHYKKISQAHKGKVYSCKTWKVISPEGKIEIIENLSKYCRKNGLNRSNIKRDYGSKGYKAEILKNHRIISVEKLDDKRIVGSISVDNNETYHSHHTYLLDAGVYTKNTMTEDFWFPRRGGERSTEVDILAGGNSSALGSDENLQYFQKQLYKSLKVPVSRLEPETMHSFGRASEITRDELKFSKLIRRLRNRFSALFDTCLEKQLILKGIITPEEWSEIKNRIRYDFMKDNYFEELKQAEILKEKMGTLREVEEQIGKYFSREWVIKNVLYMSEDDMREMNKQIEKEKAAGLYGDDMQDVEYAGNDEPNNQETPDVEDEPEDAEESLQIINKKKFYSKKGSEQ